MKKTKRMGKRLLLLLAVATTLSAARAQDRGLGEMIFSAATVTQDGSGRDWAWIQWMATDASLLEGRRLDVYLKTGQSSSSSAFELKGAAMRTVDPHAISVLLSRAVVLGEDTNRLECAVDSLFADALPDASLSLSEKLAAVVAGSADDDALYRNLTFLCRAHPAAAMANGQGFALRIPAGYSTIEIRDHASGRVMGRNTVRAGSPPVLPAPGPLTQVQETSPRGNLNVRLRWDVPDALKRMSLLQFGYDVYRMPKAWAENPSRRYDQTPPAADQIESLVDGTNVLKVNPLPILVDPSTATSATWYLIDDNSCRPGVDFSDGEQYYYFVAASDLLGRPGELSAGLLAAPFDRMAPNVPGNVRVRAISDYALGNRIQWLRVSWTHDTNDTDVAGYYVYRYRSIAEMQSNATYAVSNRISGLILPSAGESRPRYDDHGLSSGDYGVTYWYTVRAVDGATHPNLSGNSGPAYGTLRDWQGPPPPTNVQIFIRVEHLECVFDHADKAIVDDAYNIRLCCSRPSTNSRIAWAEFSYLPGRQLEGQGTNAIPLGRYWFRGRETIVVRDFHLNPKGDDDLITVYCRVGSSHKGRTSDYAEVETTTAVGEEGVNVACFQGTDWVVSVPSDVDPGPHVWETPIISNVVIHVPPTPDAATYRLYRRVDGGKTTLVAQGTMDVVYGAWIEDVSGGTVNGAHVCYYCQLFDANGNSGPLVRIGTGPCILLDPRAELPRPVLNPVEPSGSATINPGLRIEWFCPGQGVERFELAVSLDQTSLPSSFSPQLRDLEIAASNVLEVVVDGVTNSLPFGFYRTGRVGGNFGNSTDAVFSVVADALLNEDYVMMVRAVSASGAVGPWSNARAFRWASVPTPGPQVPWPTRPLPLIQQATFHSNLTARFLSPAEGYLEMAGRRRVGIRIGELPPAVTEIDLLKNYQVVIPGDYDPMDMLYENQDEPGTTAFPCALYRYQVANAFFPQVSGDVVQVSPMMENIAYGKNGGQTTLYDPFILVTKKTGAVEPFAIYLIDTQPVLNHATYQYLLVRFGENKEIDRIIPVGTATIPDERTEP